ncbi:MAG: tetratricopeptide repeat protein [Acidobacteriota bacterium]
MSQHLTRKDMKRDELANAMERGVEYAESHARTLMTAIGALLAIALLAALWFMYSNNRAEKANVALAQAIKVYQAPVDPAAPKPDDPQNPTFADEAARRTKAKGLFEKLHDDFGSTAAGDIAAVYLGQIALAEGQADRARELWNGFVDEHGDHLLAGETRVNLFRLDRNSGKAEDVATKLSAMLDQSEPPLPQDVILGELAATQEQLGKKQDAVQTYQRIVDEFPQSPYAREANQKIAELDPSRAGAGGAGFPGGLPPGMTGF